MPNKDHEKERAYQRAYRARHLEKVRARDREWKQKNAHRFKGYSAKFHAKHPEKRRIYAERYRLSGRQKENQRKWRYGVTSEMLAALLIEQNNCCAVCGVPFTERTPYIDHDHKTGKVRGLVHMKCNTLMGLAGDDPEVLEKAARYLRRNGK
jgi:Recombination endonuclease VII